MISNQSYKFSMGTMPICVTLKELLLAESPLYDTVMINLGTILRNCSSNESVVEAKREEKRLGKRTATPAAILVKEAKDEILNFTRLVCELMNSNQAIYNPCVLVYFVNYSKCIPKNYYKPHTESEREVSLAETMLRGVIHGVKKEGDYHRVNFIEYPIDDKIFPHRLLFKEFGNIKNSHKVIMISNHRVDYHIHKFCSDFILIDSFTGNILQTKDLPKKVFKDESVPFLTTTHAILGDKDDIKSDFPRKERAALVEMAKTKNWIAHTDEYVRQALRMLNIRIPFEI